MNRKGFMMAEVIIVSSIVLVVLVSLFTSYGKIFKTYNDRMTYNDVTALYRLSYIRDCMVDDADIDINTFFNDKKVATPTRITSYVNSNTNSKYNEIVYLVYVKNALSNINNISNVSDVHQTFKEYAGYLSTSAIVSSDFLMIMEMCDKNNVNSCRYAYLEIYA